MSPTVSFALNAIAAATPLLLCATGEALTEKAGVINIGIEGELLAGAFAAYAASASGAPAWLACAAAAGAGALLSALFGLLTVAVRGDQIVAGTAVNLLALGATGAAFRLWWLEGGLAAAALSPAIGSLTWLDLAALASPPAAAAFLFRTSWGLRLRACGESLSDARALAIPASRYRAAAVTASGVLCGLGGAALTLELSTTFVEGMSAGRGFVALALVAFGRWNPLFAGAAALAFGVLDALQYRLQAAGLLRLPPQALLMLPYVASLAVLAGFAGRTRPPADLGRAEE